MRGAVLCGPRIELAKMTPELLVANESGCDGRIGAWMKIAFYLDVTSPGVLGAAGMKGTERTVRRKS